MSSVTMKPAVHPFQTDDPRLRSIHDKVVAKQSLELTEIVALYESNDILALGWLANFVRERTQGNTTRFVANEFPESGAEEVIVVAATLDAVVDEVETLKKQESTARLSAFTVEQLAVEADPEKASQRLRQAGVDALIGQSAELFANSVRRFVWQTASSPAQRARAREAAKAAGLRVPMYMVQRNASPAEQAAELISFRQEPGESFCAISYPADETTSPTLATTTGMQEMKQIAIARLVLENVQHIRAYWQMLGGKLAQIALRFGASEIDGTAISRTVNTEARRHEIAREITVAGRDPQEAKFVRKAIVVA